MCLHIEYNYKNQEDNQIRWKAVCYRKVNNNLLVSPFYQCSKNYKRTGNIARLNGNPAEEGFHVFVNREDARQLANEHGFSEHGFIKICVRGFLQGGTFRNNNCETWERFDIVSPLYINERTIVKGKIRK